MIPGLPQVGIIELLILLFIVLLFFGAKRLPGLAHSLGKGIREFRQGLSRADDEDKDKLLQEERSSKDDEDKTSVESAHTAAEKKPGTTTL